MKTIIALALLLAQSQSMEIPKTERKTETQTQSYTIIERTCPPGYEGHYVDVSPGFEGAWQGGVFGAEGAPVFTICFKKEFMDQVRKNPDLQTNRPVIHGV